MSFEHIAWAMRHAEVETSTQRLVLIALADCIRVPYEYCWPSQQTIADTVKLNIDTVGRTIKRLAELHLVTVQERKRADGSREPNRYYLPKLELRVVPPGDDQKNDSDTPPAQSRMDLQTHPTLSRVPPRTESEEPIHKTNLERASPYKPPKGGRLAKQPTLVGEEKYSREFTDFWQSYPKGKGGSKTEAYKSWLKLLLDEPDQQEARTRLHFDVSQRAQFHRGWLTGFIPMMATYLNQKRWEDDIDTSTGPTTNGRAKTSYEQVMEASERNRAALREDYDNLSPDEQRDFRAAFGH